MITNRRAAAILTTLTLAVGLAACGDDDADADAASTTSTAAESTTTTAPASDAVADEGDAAAVAAAVATVFDSTIAFDEKVALLEGGESLRAAHDAYVAGAQRVGGIAVEATDVAVEGDTAEVTYRVLFAGTEAYRDLTMAATRTDGVWAIPTDDFCGFLASARTPCEG